MKATSVSRGQESDAEFRKIAMASVAFHTREALQGGDTPLALALANALLEVDPGHTEAQLIQAGLVSASGPPDELDKSRALGHAARVLGSLDPTKRAQVIHDLALLGITQHDVLEFAQCLQKQEAPMEACNLLTTASEAEPNSDSLLHEAARSYVWMNDRVGAVAWLENMASKRQLPVQSYVLMLDCLNELCEYSRTVTIAESLTKDRDGVPTPSLVPIANAHLALALEGTAWPEPSITVAQMMTLMSHALNSKLGFCAIRVGDGESRLLAAFYEVSGQAQLDRPQREAVLDLVWRNWFGCSPQDSVEDPQRIATELLNACVNSDVIGLPSSERLLRDGKHRGWLLAGMLLVTETLATWDGKTADANFNEKVDADFDLLIRLAQQANDVVIVCPHSDLGPMLTKMLGRLVTPILVPMEHGYAASNEEPQAHLRQFPAIRERVRNVAPGSLVLVAAGVLGKVYCSDVKQAGSVALDIGALADAWVGKRTRPGAFQDVRSLASRYEQLR